MPATYTYNDAVEDAKIIVAKAIEEEANKLPVDLAEQHVKLMVQIIGRLDDLKRRSRRKRSAANGEVATSARPAGST